MTTVEDMQLEATDALTIVSRQRNMALHEAAMQETRAMKAERLLQKASQRIAELEQEVADLSPAKPNGEHKEAL